MEDISTESAFAPGSTETEVRGYFEGKIKGGMFKSNDRITELERRYAPVGVFDVSRMEEVKEGVLSAITKNLKKNNTFYINLNDASLYYITRDIFKRKSNVKILDIIKKIVDLPLESIAILSDIAKHGEISHEELNKGHFLFLNRGIDNILILQTRGLIEIRYKVLHSVPLGYANNVDMPAFDEKGYNLKESLCVDNMGRGYKTDPTIYSPAAISEILKVFFGGEVELKGVVYIPYDKCKYTDKKNRFRYETLISPKFL